MADTQAKKVLSGLWADDGDRTNPDDSSLSPALDRSAGWPAEFSQADGETVRRRVINQLFREVDGAVVDILRYGGTLPYDEDIDYLQYARCSVGLAEYVALQANGPSTTAVQPGAPGSGTVWQEVQGERRIPGTPSTPTGTGSESSIVWEWGTPTDGGSEITDFYVRTRPTGTTPWTEIVVPRRAGVIFPRFSQTGLTVGQN